MSYTFAKVVYKFYTCKQNTQNIYSLTFINNKPTIVNKKCIENLAKSGGDGENKT